MKLPPVSVRVLSRASAITVISALSLSLVGTPAFAEATTPKVIVINPTADEQVADQSLSDIEAEVEALLAEDDDVFPTSPEEAAAASHDTETNQGETQDLDGKAETVDKAVKKTEEPRPPLATLDIDIDLASQRMTVSERGEEKHSWLISSGRWGYKSPTGTFKPVWMTKMWHSRQYDFAPMPYSIFFHKGVAIHATYATRKLGRPASHGCIRLSKKNARTLYKLVSKHGKARTEIVVHGEPDFSTRYVTRRKSRKAKRYVNNQYRPQPAARKVTPRYRQAKPKYRPQRRAPRPRGLFSGY